LFSALALSVVAIGCGPKVDDDSEIQQLSGKAFKCDDADAARIQDVFTRLPADFIQGWDDQSSIPRIKSLIANLPDEYLEFFRGLSARKTFYVTQKNLPGSTAGVTSWSGQSSGNVTLDSDSSMAIFALQHEFGHAVHHMYFPSKGRKISTSQLEQLMAEGSRSGKLRSYALSSTSEYFAESFNNYYCSPQAHDFIKTNLPVTYSYMSQTLQPPRWVQPGSTGGGIAPPTAALEIAAHLLPASTTTPAAGVEMVASAGMNAVRLFACTAPAATCKASPTANIEFKQLQVVTPGPVQRNYFQSMTPINPAATAAMSLISLDAAGKVIFVKPIQFKARALAF